MDRNKMMSKRKKGSVIAKLVSPESSKDPTLPILSTPDWFMTPRRSSSLQYYHYHSKDGMHASKVFIMLVVLVVMDTSHQCWTP